MVWFYINAILTSFAFFLTINAIIQLINIHIRALDPRILLLTIFGGTMSMFGLITGIKGLLSTIQF